MTNCKFPLALLTVVAGLTLTAYAQTESPAATPEAGVTLSSLDLIRADIKNEKAVIIARNMEFTADETAEFWPLYNEYTEALRSLLDVRMGLIREYVDMHDKMTDQQATALAAKVFDFEAKRVELKRTWFKKFTEVVPAKKAAQFVQIEGLLNAALDLKLMDALPLIK